MRTGMHGGHEIAPGIRCLRCDNPGPFTGPGTNTYLVGDAREVAVVDPGPDDPAHRAALAAATWGACVAAILVTHAHLDHSQGAPALGARTGAPVLAFGPATAGRDPALAGLPVGGGEGLDAGFAPDRALADCEVLAIGGRRIEALHTPGHFGGHLAFAVGDVCLSGDLVLGWASTLISPPDGDLVRFRESCARLRARGFARLLPGHGAPVDDPAARIDELLAHRAARDAQILAALASAPGTPADVAARVYDVAPALRPAAARNVLAHLLAARAEGRVACDGPPGPGAVFRPC